MKPSCSLCRPALLLGALLALGPLPAARAAKLTYVDLVRRLTDLEALAVPPLPGERCEQWSSYDRASRFDAAAGKYLRWDANGDGDGFIRREGDRIVMAEIDGPGCLWRIWSAAPKQGHVRIYLDGAVEPVVDLPFAGYFDGKNAPFNRTSLVHMVALGWNNYTPIPFRKSCRVVADKDWGQYFQFVYSRFPADTELPAFRRELSDEENAALDAADRKLRASEPSGPRPESDSLKRTTAVLRANGGVWGLDIPGPRALVGLRAKIDDLPASPADREVLRQLTLEIRWDNETRPSVWVPFGDFFGTAPGANPYQSFPCGLTSDGWWYSRWYMPFGRIARLRVVNDGPVERRIQIELEQAPLKADPATLARFHAKWHRDVFPPEDPARRAIDWTLLNTRGRGRFAGVMLHVWNPKGGWWGEGDEKFFVDGEKFPSTLGTGSEDYFGYAWCNPTLFQNAYHNQTISMNNRGHVSVNRWHITDNIPFQTGFEASIEKYFPNSRPTLYAATVFWYQLTGGADPHDPVPLSERVGYWDDTVLQAHFVKGAVEGERMKVLRRTGGSLEVQDMAGFGGDWSGDGQLWWTQAKPGERLELVLPVAAAGHYRVKAQFTRAVDYGIARFSIDGRNLGEPVDFYHDGVEATGAVSLGEAELAAGERTLAIEITGANPKAVPAHMVGLDYVLLERVR